VHLSRLSLSDFRGYAQAEVALEPGVSTFTGANGQGKTNLIEAVGYLAMFASHRVATDAPLVRRGAQRAILRAAISSSVRESLLEVEINPGRANRVRLNRVPVPRPRAALGTLRCVLFAPEDLVVVKGDPDQRRRYLDDLLVATRPRYAAVRAEYERIVRQRTALLKNAKSSGLPSGALEVWDDRLVSTGAELTAGRLALVAAVRPLVARAYAAVSGEEQIVGVKYRQPFSQNGDPPEDAPALAAELRASVQRWRRAELDRCVCLVGPHRDELELAVGELPARGYASQGESWSLALALRMAAYELLRAQGDDPVLLLDDVFAELDSRRRERLAELVADAEQVLVTAAVPADVPDKLAGTRFSVSAGTIEVASGDRA
jgi:DNA replication and repair protein RecF